MRIAHAGVSVLVRGKASRSLWMVVGFPRNFGKISQIVIKKNPNEIKVENAKRPGLSSLLKQNHKGILKFFSSFNWSFTPHPGIDHLDDGGQHDCGRESGSARGKPITIPKLLSGLLTYF